jgi:hypothetical protein
MNEMFDRRILEGILEEYHSTQKKELHENKDEKDNSNTNQWQGRDGQNDYS